MAEATQEQVTEAPATPAAPAVPASKPGMKVVTETLDIPVFTEQKPKAEVATEGDQKTGEEATLPGDKKPVTTDEQPEKPGKNRFARRLDAAYRKAAEAQGRADFLEKQLAEARQQSPQPVAPGEPRLEDFSDIKKYAEAYAKWNTESVLKQQEQTRQVEATKTSQAKLVAEWEGKVKLGDEKYDDFDEIVGDLSPTTPWAMAVMSAENAHDVAYYLGTHLDEAKRIIALDPVSQIREVGGVSAKLLLQPPTPKASSKAPAPIAPVTGTSGGAKDIWDKDVPFKTFMKARQKQVHGR
jgi:hypothetical protein